MRAANCHRSCRERTARSGSYAASCRGLIAPTEVDAAWRQIERDKLKRHVAEIALVKPLVDPRHVRDLPELPVRAEHLGRHSDDAVSDCGGKRRQRQTGNHMIGFLDAPGGEDLIQPAGVTLDDVIRRKLVTQKSAE